MVELYLRDPLILNFFYILDSDIITSFSVKILQSISRSLVHVEIALIKVCRTYSSTGAQVEKALLVAQQPRDAYVTLHTARLVSTTRRPKVHPLGGQLPGADRTRRLTNRLPAGRTATVNEKLHSTHTSRPKLRRPSVNMYKNPSPHSDIFIYIYIYIHKHTRHMDTFLYVRIIYVQFSYWQ